MLPIFPYLLLPCLVSVLAEMPILGLSIGPRYLTVVQSLDDGSTALIAQVEADTAHSKWYAKVNSA